MTNGRGKGGDPIVAQLLEIFQQIAKNQALQAASHVHDEVTERMAQQNIMQQATALMALATQGRFEQQKMSAEQSRTEVRFRALRMALGSTGRHGESADNALLTGLELDRQGNLAFTKGVDPRAATLKLYYPGGRTQEVSVKSLTGEPPQLAGAAEVSGVECVGDDGRTLVFGVPRRTTL